MDSIYMNNFRGFSDTLVPIRSVNFLVGENSTGKTSFLALAELFCLPDFWFTLDFNAGDYEFGGYSDIVSALSRDRTEFQVGVSKKTGDETAERTYWLMHFRAAPDGIPTLARLSVLKGDCFATMGIGKARISASLLMESKQARDLSSPEDCFAFMLHQSSQQTSGYKVMRGEQVDFVRQAPVMSFGHVLSLLFKGAKPLTSVRPLAFLEGPSMSFAGMAPIRTTPKRTYDGYTKRFSPDGEHTPYVIRTELTRPKGKTNAFAAALETFGDGSGLFESVRVSQFGQDSASPFEIKVVLGQKALRMNSVGYGVSQVLPIVVELLTRDETSWLAIQQPEVHLHPKAQAALGDVLFHAAVDESKTLLVETHSDYLLDRFRLSMRDNKHPRDFMQVLFFERGKDGNCICPMVIDAKGQYPEGQPAGFREFFLAEQRRILGI